MKLIALALMLTATVAVRAEPPDSGHLTEAAALRIGLAQSDLTDVIDGTVAQARASVEEAGVWPNPTLDYDYERVNGAVGEIVEQKARLSQTFDVSGRRALRQDAASERAEAAVSDGKTRRLELAGEIRRVFYSALFRQLQLAAVVDWEKRLDTVEAIVRKLEAAGEVSGYDRRRVSREQGTARARLATERGAYARAAGQLSGLIGTTTLPGRHGLTGSLVPSEPPPLDRLIALLKDRPDMRSLERHTAAAGLEGRAAERGWIPDLTLGVGPKRIEEGPTRESGLLFTVSLPIPVFDRQQYRHQRAAGEALAARGRYRLALARAEGDLRGVWQQSRSLAAAASVLRSETEKQSAELTGIAETAYRAGEAGILELLDAYRAALEAQTTALELEWNARQARIELDQLAGVLP
jgi:cobalt-zinc-cadmium efflux system outer membrane protein